VVILSRASLEKNHNKFEEHVICSICAPTFPHAIIKQYKPLFLLQNEHFYPVRFYAEKYTILNVI